MSLFTVPIKSFLFSAQFDYCDVVWSGCTQNEALRLETLLNFACRTVLRRHRDYSASAARSELGLSTLSARRKLGPNYVQMLVFPVSSLSLSTFLFPNLSL